MRIKGTLFLIAIVILQLQYIATFSSEIPACPPFPDCIAPPLEEPSQSILQGKVPREQVNDFLPPVVGIRRIAVILVEFSDVVSRVDRNSIETGILARMDVYWREVSFGSIQISGACFGWYRLNRPTAYYGADGKVRDDPNSDGESESWWLIRDAIERSDRDVDFKNYDHVVIVHAGAGQESDKRRTELIWSVHYSSLSITTSDGITIKSASITPEYQLDADILGVNCHEFGHELGLPDLYDVDGDKDFVGRWCLMGSGNWNGQPRGSLPAHPMAYCKMRLGWLPKGNIKTIYSSETASLESLDSRSAVLQAMMLPLTDKTYYLVEVRLRRGFDSSLPSEGVIISLIDERKRSGEGIVRVIDANPNSESLNDAAWARGQAFQDRQNDVLVAVEPSGPSYSIKVQRSPIRFYLTMKSQHPVWIRIDNINYSLQADELLKLHLPAKTYMIEIQHIMRLGPGSRLIFSQWNDGDVSNPRAIDLFEDAAIIAVYKTQHYLEVRSKYGQTNGTGWYDEGTIAHFSVSPTVTSEGAFGYQFDKWEGDAATTTSSSTILIDRPKVVTAGWRTMTPWALILILLVVVVSCASLLPFIARKRRLPRPAPVGRFGIAPTRGIVTARIASCPRCHHMLRWIPEHRKYYCDSCARYV
jgi:M6 family metalloprotease-like protein